MPLAHDVRLVLIRLSGVNNWHRNTELTVVLKGLKFELEKRQIKTPLGKSKKYK